MIGMRTGLKTGIRPGVAVGIGADTVGNGYNPMDGVPKDATSGKYTPLSAADWASVRSAAGVSAGTVSSVWLCQEAAGDLADSVGANTLTKFGAPTYRQAQAGWTRLALSMNSTGNAFYSVAVGNTATTSFLIFALASFPSTPVSSQPLINVGGGAAAADSRQAAVHTNGAIRAQGNGGQAAASGSTDMSTTVHPLWLLFNRASSTFAVINNIEAVNPAWTNPTSGTSAYMSFEGISSAQILLAAMFSGAAAEVSIANVQAMNTAMGW